MKKVFAVLLTLVILVSCVSCGAESSQDTSLFDAVMSADEALEAAKRESVVVFEDSKCIAGDKIWDEFYKTAIRGEAASVLCASYHTLDRKNVSEELYQAEKDKYPMLFFEKLEYDGNTFKITVRLSTEEELDYEESFKYLMHYTGDAPAMADFSAYDYYVLVDDPTATWEEIMAGMVSSQMGTRVKHYAVYMNTFD